MFQMDGCSGCMDVIYLQTYMISHTEYFDMEVQHIMRQHI